MIFNKLRFLNFISLFLFLFLASHSVHAGSEYKKKTITAGSDTFLRFCSVCHGQDASGAGPFANNLNTPPTDLTVLSKNNNQQFPWLRLYETIAGKTDVAEHGSREMPIWGEIFDISQWSNQNNNFSEVIVRGRIFELLIYLESIQTNNQK